MNNIILAMLFVFIGWSVQAGDLPERFDLFENGSFWAKGDSFDCALLSWGATKKDTCLSYSPEVKPNAISVDISKVVPITDLGLYNFLHMSDSENGFIHELGVKNVQGKRGHFSVSDDTTSDMFYGFVNRSKTHGWSVIAGVKRPYRQDVPSSSLYELHANGEHVVNVLFFHVKYEKFSIDCQEKELCLVGERKSKTDVVLDCYLHYNENKPSYCTYRGKKSILSANELPPLKCLLNIDRTKQPEVGMQALIEIAEHFNYNL
jgi:hypothetical protein